MYHLACKPVTVPVFILEMTTYILHFSNEFSQFRLAELSAVAEKLGLQLAAIDDQLVDCPFLKYRGLSPADVISLSQRSVSIRAIYEYWTEGSSFEEIIEKINSYPKAEDSELKSFKISIECFARTYANRTQQKLEKIHQIAGALNHKGRIKLESPDETFTLFEYYGPHGCKPNDAPERLYFGKLVLETGREANLRKFTINSRKFIGNTTMDPTLAFIMANMAKLDHTSIVLDPFVGTGSLLLACAFLGAYVIGTDINKVLLHGRGKSSRHKAKWRERDENVLANFYQYGLASKYLDVMVADASKHEMWHYDGLFDAIVTDPPYGIREQTKKLSAPPADVKKPYFMPPETPYNLSDVFSDLLELSSRCLKLSGRLIYWLPIYRPDYDDQNVPSHPCFKLISNSEQVLSTNISRRLITMEKVLEPHLIDKEEWQKISYKDHYKESFRDRYFQLNDKTSKLDISCNEPI